APSDERTTVAAGAMVGPGIRPALGRGVVCWPNIGTGPRHSSSPSSSPCITGLMRLAFESTQHGADILLAASRQLEEDLFQRLSVLSDHVAELLEAAHGHQTSAVDDGEAGAHPLRDLQDVGREENCLPFPAEVLEDVLP